MHFAIRRVTTKLAFRKQCPTILDEHAHPQQPQHSHYNIHNGSHTTTSSTTISHHHYNHSCVISRYYSHQHQQQVVRPKQQLRSIVHMTTFYKRQLPSKLIAFSSDQGKAIFRESLSQGHMENFFTLSENLQIQSQPAYCGLGTLTMVLNSLQIDPGRNWKGVWRWFSEEMFDCCTSLATIQRNGLTLDQFWCLSKCNGADATLVRPDHSSEEEFRDLVKHATSNKNSGFVVVNFDRKVLEQTGDGHFSVIAGYNERLDSVLLMETARFKYPSYWVPLKDLWRAMYSIDSTSGELRGFLTLRSASEGLSLLYTIFLTHKISWRQFALLFSTQVAPDIIEKNNIGSQFNRERLSTLQDLITLFVGHLPKEIESVLLEYSQTVMFESTTCTDHRNDVPDLLNDIRNLALFQLVSRAFQETSPNNSQKTTDQLDESQCTIQFNDLHHAPYCQELVTLLLMTCPIDCLSSIIPAHILQEWNDKYRDLNVISGSCSEHLTDELHKMRRLIQTLCAMKSNPAGNVVASGISHCSNTQCLKRCHSSTGNDHLIIKQGLDKTTVHGNGLIDQGQAVVAVAEHNSHHQCTTTGKCPHHHQPNYQAKN